MTEGATTPPASDPDHEFRQLVDATRLMLRRRAIIWCVRWTIGFGLTAVVTSVSPSLYWLWYLAIGTALASLLFLVAVAWSIERRIRATAARLRGPTNQ